MQCKPTCSAQTVSNAVQCSGSFGSFGRLGSCEHRLTSVILNFPHFLALMRCWLFSLSLYNVLLNPPMASGSETAEDVESMRTFQSKVYMPVQNTSVLIVSMVTKKMGHSLIDI